jgi:hypothetical protein
VPLKTTPVRLLLGAGPVRVAVDTRGLPVAATPGLIVVPRHRLAAGQVALVPGSFWLVHARTGRPLVSLAWCAHDVRRWALTAGQIGVDWTVAPFTLHASKVVKVFVWWLHNEYRAACRNCVNAGIARNGAIM